MGDYDVIEINNISLSDRFCEVRLVVLEYFNKKYQHLESVAIQITEEKNRNNDSVPTIDAVAQFYSILKQSIHAIDNGIAEGVLENPRDNEYIYYTTRYAFHFKFTNIRNDQINSESIISIKDWTLIMSIAKRIGRIGSTYSPVIRYEINPILPQLKLPSITTTVKVEELYKTISDRLNKLNINSKPIQSLKRRV